MGNVRHFAINADDLSRARRFYERVFGWTFDPARQTAQDEVIQEDGYHFLGIRVDGFDVRPRRLGPVGRCAG